MRHVLLAEDGERVPIVVWGRDSPRGALAQLRRVAAQPWVTGRVAGMPDLHVAKGIAVGTVFATNDALVPEALGDDLGCGMSAVRFPFAAASLSRRDLEALLAELARRIPVGDAVHRRRGPELPDSLLARPLSTNALEHARRRLAPKHLGTLGGGNHFLELDRDAGGELWLLVHSGSRGVGAAVAEHHLRVAKAVGTGDLEGIAAESPEGLAFRSDLELALEFARANREALVQTAAGVLKKALGVEPDEERRVDVHHNFIRQELHEGRPLWIHRKGAIAAPEGNLALIPGSMGTASYLVEGLGAPDAFASASHGAGRVLSRGEARRRIAEKRLHASMRRVVFDARHAPDLVEEAPEAYRDIGEVLEDEADLVRPVTRLEPIAVLKG